MRRTEIIETKIQGNNSNPLTEFDRAVNQIDVIIKSVDKLMFAVFATKVAYALEIVKKGFAIHGVNFAKT